MDVREMNSFTYGKVTMDKIAEIIAENVNKGTSEQYQVVIGTDSQNFDKTKIVLVIAVIQHKKGGFFFYEISRIKKIMDIKQKLYTETQMSLDCANELLEAFERLHDRTSFDYTQIHFTIHVDAGFNGPTKEVIPGIVGWVKSCGFEVQVKPDSYVASTIADRLSK